MNAIIIEDEIPAGRRLEKLLTEKEITVLTIIYSVSDAIVWFKNNHHPDLVFMDIKLRDGLCFKIFDLIEIKSKIVFTTAYDEYALKAFEYNSIHYLLKPLDVAKLDKMLSKIENINFESVNNEDLKSIENRLYRNHKNSFLVTIGSSLKKILEQEIIFFISENNTSFIVTKENRNYIINQSLEKLEKQLNPDLFFRINRKIIINKIFIDRLTDFQLHLNIKITNENLKVSRKRIKSFLEFYKK